MTNVTLPVRSMRKNAFGAKGAPTVRVSRICPRAGRPNASVSPPPIEVAASLRNRRRADDVTPRILGDALFISASGVLGGTASLGRSDTGRVLDRSTDTQIGSASADVACHRGVDICIARFRGARQ